MFLNLFWVAAPFLAVEQFSGTPEVFLGIPGWEPLPYTLYQNKFQAIKVNFDISNLFSTTVNKSCKNNSLRQNRKRNSRWIRVSISPTFYDQIICKKVFYKAFLHFQLVFVIFWRIGKLEQKQLVKCWWNWPNRLAHLLTFFKVFHFVFDSVERKKNRQKLTELVLDFAHTHTLTRTHTLTHTHTHTHSHAHHSHLTLSFRWRLFLTIIYHFSYLWRHHYHCYSKYLLQCEFRIWKHICFISISHNNRRCLNVTR